MQTDNDNDNDNVVCFFKANSVLAELCKVLQTIYAETSTGERPHIFKSAPKMAKYLLEKGEIEADDYLIIRGLFAEINDTETEITDMTKILETVHHLILRIKKNNNF